MKLKTLLLSLVFGLCIQLPTLAEQTQDRSTAIMFNPLGLLLGRAGGEWGIKISDRVALTVPFSFQFLGVGNLNNRNISTVLGGTLGLGAKIYLSDTAIKSSWFVKPTATVGIYAVQGNTSIYISPSIIGGYGWVFDSGFSLNLGAGPSMNFQKIGGDWIMYPWFELEAAIGYSW